MNLTLNHPLRRLYMNSGEAAGGTDTVVDRGDSIDPPEDQTGAGGASEAEQAAALEKELADKAPADANGTETDPNADPDAAKTDAKKDTRIPLSRHEKILQKERDARQAVERELKKYQGGAQVADLNADIKKAEDTVSVLEKEYAKLITDGESEKAAAKMAEIRRTEREINEAKNDAKIASAVARATENVRYSTALERIESEYPVLNEDHDDFDEEVFGEVVELMNGYKAQGYTPTDALQKAVKKELGAKTAAQKKVVDTTPRVDPKDVAAARKKEAATKTANAVESTPASTAKVGVDSDKIGGSLSAKAIMGMNQKDFAKLPDEALARLRGDEL